MNRLIKSAITERKVTLLLSFFVILYGAYAYYYLPRQETPDTASPAVQITTIYPGATAKDVEIQVTKLIEDEVAALDNLDFMRSYSQDNVSIVYALLENEADYAAAWDELRNSLQAISGNFPDGVETPKVFTDITVTPAVIISLSSDTYNAGQLSTFAERVKDDLGSINGVRKVAVEGEKEKRITIDVDTSKLSGIGLTMKDVVQLIGAQNVLIPTGKLTYDSGEINVQATKAINTIEDLEQLILMISPENGSVVRLKDIADVEFAYEDGSLYYTKDSRSSVLVTAYFQEDINVVLIGEDVRGEIERIKNDLPEGVLFDEVVFVPDDVEASVNDFIFNLLQGIIFVIFVILIGMGFRNALVVSLAIPLSVAITFVFMSIFGIELQQVSISALIIALGMLVDNAIVISDAIQVKINQGYSNLKAAYLGTTEQAIPVFTSTLTTIAAFTPLIALPGAAGEFLSSLPMVVIISLIASYVVAMLVTPAMGSLTLSEKKEHRSFVDVLGDIYTKILAFNLKRPVVTLAVVLVCVVSAGYLFLTTVDIKMFPYVDKDVIYFNIENEIIGNIDETHKLVGRVSDILSNQPEIMDMTLSTGGGLPRFYLTSEFIIPSSKNGQIYATFDLSASDRFKTRGEFLYYLQGELDKQFTGGYATARLLEINNPGPAVEVKLSGDETEVKMASKKIYEYLAQQNGTMNIIINQPTYTYQYKINIDEDKALSYGLTTYDIQYQMYLALSGVNIGSLKTAGNSFDIYASADIKTLEKLENLNIKSEITSNTVRVKQIAEVSLEPAVNQILRIDRENVITIASDINPYMGANNLQQDLQDYVRSLNLNDVKVTYGGDAETISKYLSGLGAAAVFAVIAIYLILLIQFNSFVQPFIILTTIPLALIGIVLALVMTNTNFTFTVGLGAASLIGVVVNNGILLIEYINRARAEGMDVIEACRVSASQRMRPVLLSTITTIFGLVPLVFADSSFFTPMAIALIGGLLVATLMTITVVPTVYSLLTKIERKKPTIEID